MSDGSHDVLQKLETEHDESVDEWCLSGKCFSDEFDPESIEEPESDSPTLVEPLIDRLRIVFWDFHQVYVAYALLACLVCMSGFFLIKSYQLNGLVDIDQATSIPVTFQVDINSAQIGEIVVLPGVGRRLAGAILEYRESVGGFDTHENLCDVPGIGEKKLEAMRQYLLPIEVVVE